MRRGWLTVLLVAMLAQMSMAFTPIGPADDEDEDPVAEVPPPPFDPDEVAPYLAPLGPAGTATCGTIGLIFGLAGTGLLPLDEMPEELAAVVEEVSISTLGAIFLVCGYIPAAHPEQCDPADADVASLVAQLGEQAPVLVEVPPPSGTIVDTIASLEGLIAEAGAPADGTVSDPLGDALNCHPSSRDDLGGVPPPDAPDMGAVPPPPAPPTDRAGFGTTGGDATTPPAAVPVAPPAATPTAPSDPSVAAPGGTSGPATGRDATVPTASAPQLDESLITSSRATSMLLPLLALALAGLLGHGLTRDRPAAA